METWKDRITEIHKYGVWLEAFTSWVSVAAQQSIAGLLESVGGMQRASGYELLRKITKEFSLQSQRGVALGTSSCRIRSLTDQLARDCIG